MAGGRSPTRASSACRRAVVAGALNGVNGPDLAVANVASDDVSVLLNLCAAERLVLHLDIKPGSCRSLFNRNRNDVVEAINLDEVDREFVELQVTGTLPDGTEFAARDSIRLVPPGDIDGACALGSPTS
jgi:hypothetical protein